MELNIKEKKNMDRKDQGNHRKSVPGFSKLLKVHTVRLGLLETQVAENIQQMFWLNW